MRPLVGPTVAALDADGPRDEDTVVTFTDPVNLGSSGFTLLLALERDGFDTYADESWRAAVGDRRACRRPTPTARCTSAWATTTSSCGAPTSGCRSWRRSTPARRSSASRCVTPRKRWWPSSSAAASPELARELETVRLVAVSDPDFPADLANDLHRLSDLPQPVAVFLSSDPGSAPEPPEAAEGGE